MPSAEVVHDDVGAGGEVFEGGPPLGGFHVEGRGFFAAVEDMERHGVIVAEGGAHAAGVIAAVGAFDFDHFGTEVGEDGADEGAGEDLAEFDHAKAGENAGREHFSGGP